jgi:hypothetical protein
MRAACMGTAAAWAVALTASESVAQRAPLPDPGSEVLICAELPADARPCDRLVPVRVVKPSPVLVAKPTSAPFHIEHADDVEAVRILLERDLLQLFAQITGLSSSTRAANDRLAEAAGLPLQAELAELERTRVRGTALEVEEIQRKRVDAPFLSAGIALLGAGLAVDHWLGPTGDRPLHLRPRFYPPGMRMKIRLF